MIIASSFGQASGSCLGDGLGDFTTCANISETEDDDALDVAMGDLNKDGFPDVLFANRFENRLCLNDGMGAFTSCSSFANNNRVSSGIELTDLNRDGFLDAVIANKGFSSQMCLGVGDGTFSACLDIPLLVSNVNDVQLGDFNRDGRTDAIFANSLSLLNNEVCLAFLDGLFQSCQPILQGRGGTSEIALADLNNDGNLDAIFGQFSTESYICMGDTQGSFSTCFDIGFMSARELGTGDFDENGTADVVLFNGAANLCLGAGDASFSSCRVFGTTDLSANDFAVGDINDDGHLDVVFVGNTRTTTCLGNGLGEFTTCGDDVTSHHPGQAIVLGDVDAR